MKTKSLLLALLVAGLVAGTAGAADRKSGDYYQAYSEELTTLNYLISPSNNEHIAFANLVDGLVEYDQFGVLKPSLAKTWSVSADGLVWTFKLREGVKWYTYQAKAYADVTAQDWVDAAQYLMTKTNASQTADVIYGILKNGKDYWDGKITDFSLVGVKAKDKSTVEYTLNRPVPYFLSMLTYVCFLPVNGKFLAAAGSRFGTDNRNLLYNGAYILTDFEPQIGREFTRNEKYWDRGNVHIKRLIYKYNKEALTLSPELFLRGEVSYADIPSSLLDSWMRDPVKKAQVRPLITNSYTYFYALNFNPKFAADYEPANWKIAVNNKAFRKSIFHALDRRAAMLTSEPYTPERRLNNTITPSTFVTAGGKDYVELGDLGAIAATESFNKARAVEYKAQAMKELAGRASFPVKIMMPYRADMSDWTNRAQVVEQQLESVLGKDYIDVIPVGFPATGFLGATRRAGNYAMQEVNWGPDYADPETYTDPFVIGSNYNWPELAEGYMESNGKPKYQNMVETAKAETKDIKKRYELFAKAEAFLIGEAFVIPYARGGGGYVASKLEPFTCPFAPFGLSELKFKGQIVMPKALSTEDFKVLEEKWQKDRAAALLKAK